jgi:hypothetical protein
MVNVDIFCDHLEYFLVIWYNVWPFGIVCGHLLYFWNVWTKKTLATLFTIDPNWVAWCRTTPSGKKTTFCLNRQQSSMLSLFMYIQLLADG